MRSIDHKFYESKLWKKTRVKYVESVNGLCERCLAKGLIVPGKIVHHRIHLNEENYRDPEVALNFENLELLCQACHNEEHDPSSGNKSRRRYRFDSDGAMVMRGD